MLPMDTIRGTSDRASIDFRTFFAGGSDNTKSMVMKDERYVVAHVAIDDAHEGLPHDAWAPTAAHRTLPLQQDAWIHPVVTAGLVRSGNANLFLCKPQYFFLAHSAALAPRRNSEQLSLSFECLPHSTSSRVKA